MELQSVSKSFGSLVALQPTTIQIRAGEVIGLVGSNGAGKTTLLRLLSGVYRPTSGQIHFPQQSESQNPRLLMGIVPESSGLYARLTAWENIRYHSRLYGATDEDAWATTIKYARILGIDQDLSRHTRGFSRGMRQKTALLRAIAHRPHILLLDEPTAGLDVTSARAVKRLVRQLGDHGGTVIYSTHQLAEAQTVCDRIIIMHNGEIRADGTPQSLLDVTQTTSLEEAYVSLTNDSARVLTPDSKPESKFSLWWQSLFTKKTPMRGDEDE